MNTLEWRYWRVLRLLPAAYRQRWQDDMVDAFLESTRTGDPEADDYQRDYGRPSLSETGSVVALAVRLRLTGSAGSFGWGAAVRLAVLVILAVQAAYGLVTLSNAVWMTGWIHWLPTPPMTAPSLLPAIFHAGWLVAFLSLLLGYRRTAVWLIAGAPVLSAISQLAFGHVVAVGTIFDLMPAAILAVAVGCAFQDGVPAPRPLPWLLALAGGVIVAVVPSVTGGFWVTGDNVLAGLLIAGLVVALCRPSIPVSRQLAMVVLAVALVGARLPALTLIGYQVVSESSLALMPAVSIYLAQSVAVAALGLACAYRLRGVLSAEPLGH
ncbi:hypothetical protein [Fodinicola acaciae]|uniref:hypothetical protein n=1 Tax=Fodinicola acaciae TaxID=2681555 RepID=UPI0013D50149|nr:hypothetical protein [Fodinicola acaciae]